MALPMLSRCLTGGSLVLTGSASSWTTASSRGFTTSLKIRGTTKWHYAVRIGSQPGIYATWEEARINVHGIAGAEYQKFPSREAADAYMQGAVLEGATSCSERLVVYTDGSYTDKGHGGIGAHFAEDKTKDLSERVPQIQFAGEGPQGGSNNVSELYAVLRVLEVDPDPSRELHVYSDSLYVVQSFEGINGAPPNPSPARNRDMIMLIRHKIKKRVKPVKFTWVKGHAAVPGNVKADSLADAGTRLPGGSARDLRAELMALRQRDGAEDAATVSVPTVTASSRPVDDASASEAPVKAMSIEQKPSADEICNASKPVEVTSAAEALTAAEPPHQAISVKLDIDPELADKVIEVSISVKAKVRDEAAKTGSKATKAIKPAPKASPVKAKTAKKSRKSTVKAKAAKKSRKKPAKAKAANKSSKSVGKAETVPESRSSDAKPNSNSDSKQPVGEATTCHMISQSRSPTEVQPAVL